MACPLCGAVLSHAPKRRTLCRQCGCPILVPRGRLFTEDEARAVDICQKVSIPIERLWVARDALSQELGRQASASDAAWRPLNELVVSTTNHHERKMTYFLMARFMFEEGRDHLEVARLSRRMQLEEWKSAAQQGLLDLVKVRIKIITCGEASCPACRAVAKSRFTYEDAMAHQPIPVPECTHETNAGQTRGWCRCEYALVF